MKILVTGFDPFGGEKTNPAYEAVKLLPDSLGDAEIIKLEIPTVFTRSVSVMEGAIEKYRPHVILNIGQAGGRSSVNIEKVAINLMEARIPDNDGEQPVGEKIKADGETAYFATVPVKAMVSKVKNNQIPCNISYTAGTYVCNSIMYNMLYLTKKKYRDIRVGFIHVPYSPQQAALQKEGVPSMNIEDIARAIKYSIEAIIENKEDTNEIMGIIS